MHAIHLYLSHNPAAPSLWRCDRTWIWVDCSCKQQQRQWGGGMRGHFPPNWRFCPHTCPSPVRRKMAKNQPFLAIFFIFAPSEMYFTPSMPPHTKKKKKKNLVPPLLAKIFLSFCQKQNCNWMYVCGKGGCVAVWGVV